MNRYTTKHFWRMTESEEGEWIRHEEHQKLIEDAKQLIEDYKKLIEDYKAQEQFTWELMQEEQVRKWKAMGLAEHLSHRVHVLYIILMATYGVIVAKLIVWSLGIL